MPDLIYVYCVMDRAPVLEHVAVPEAKPAVLWQNCRTCWYVTGFMR